MLNRKRAMASHLLASAHSNERACIRGGSVLFSVNFVGSSSSNLYHMFCCFLFFSLSERRSKRTNERALVFVIVSFRLLSRIFFSSRHQLFVSVCVILFNQIVHKHSQIYVCIRDERKLPFTEAHSSVRVCENKVDPFDLVS